ncbi:sensor histidine kinase [Paenibacillus borealis]|uniref:sensor histidine kinase n=1 Tax=Paenibacillus borealis TaxID=160799 RepID=UPI0005A6CEDA|nr:HAMP domain-containing sensor histidine kinase [Paenibacillus borealis]
MEGLTLLKGIRSRLIFYITLMLLLIVLLLEGVFIAAVHYYYLGSAMETLNSRAATSATFFNKYLEGYTLSERARYILENLSPEESSKVEVLSPAGNVIINSFGFSSKEQVNTPDVRAALASGKGSFQSLKPLQGERIIAVSIALKEAGSTIGVLRYSVSAEPLYAVIMRIVLNAAVVGVLVIGFGFVMSLLIAKRIVGPIRQLTGVAKEMATGNFAVRAAKQYDDEVGTLAVTLNYMSEEILKSEKIKYDFISSVTHELRTPLTSIKGWGETLLGGDLSDKQETLQGLEVMTGETDRLIGLVEDLLDFSKFQAGEIRMVRQPYDLRGLLEDLLLQFRYRGQTKQIRLYADLPDQPLPVDGDFNRLKQVFVNLLDNAFKFTPAQGAIRLTAVLSGELIIVTVADNGEGIEAADLAQLGTKFFKGRSRQSGSGLGLAICKEIIELHDGRLRIESEFTKGTSVIVELPLYRLEQHLPPPVYL